MSNSWEEDRAKQAYDRGYTYGATVRLGGVVSPYQPDDRLYEGAWENIGRVDGMQGIPRNRFEGIGIAITADERRGYDDGYVGKPVAIQHGWYQQGALDRARNMPKRYVLERIYADAGAPIGPAPPYSGGRGPVIVAPPVGPPPVVVRPPPVGPPPGWDGYGYPPLPYGSPQRRRPRRPGIIIRGPWGEVDLADLGRLLRSDPRTYSPDEFL